MTTAVQPESTTSTPSAAPSDGGGSNAPSAAPSTPLSTSGEPITDDFLSDSKAADPFSDKPLNDPFAGADEPAAAAPLNPNAPTPITAPEPEVVPIPFKYTADGKEMDFEGIEEIPGEGLIVSADAVPRVRDALQRADHYGRQVQQYSQVVDRFQKVGGFERMEQLEANSAVLQSIGQKFLELLTNDSEVDENGFPRGLAELATNPRERALMLRELDILTRDAEMRARGQFSQSMQSVDRAGQESAARGSAITGAVGEMASAITKTFGIQLPAEDIAEAEQVFSQFADTIYRPATAQEAASLRIPVGSPIIDYPKMHPWFTARAQMRQRESASKVTVAAAEADNAKRLAATTPTRPVSARAVTQRPGAGTKPVVRPDRPEITDWRTRMKMGLSPVADAPTNP